jgi:hypothetical protein
MDRSSRFPSTVDEAKATLCKSRCYDRTAELIKMQNSTGRIACKNLARQDVQRCLGRLVLALAAEVHPQSSF